LSQAEYRASTVFGYPRVPLSIYSNGVSGLGVRTSTGLNAAAPLLVVGAFSRIQAAKRTEAEFLARARWATYL